MKAVLQPLNEQASDTLIHHVDLLRTTHIDPILLQARHPHCACLGLSWVG